MTQILPFVLNCCAAGGTGYLFLGQKRKGVFAIIYSFVFSILIWILTILGIVVLEPLVGVGFWLTCWIIAAVTILLAVGAFILTAIFASIGTMCNVFGILFCAPWFEIFFNFSKFQKESQNISTKKKRSVVCCSGCGLCFGLIPVFGFILIPIIPLPLTIPLVATFLFNFIFGLDALLLTRKSETMTGIEDGRCALKFLKILPGFQTHALPPPKNL